MQPVLPPDSHYLRAAIGWLELGSCANARAELALISSSNQLHPDVLEVAWSIHAHEQSWDSAMQAAESLVATAPSRASGWLHLAYASRRASGGGIDKAWEVLRPAADRFPQEPLIAYNLSCYASQLGQLDEARRWLKRALDLGGRKQLKAMALLDEDLAALHDEIRQL